jgi:hypothetical protein
MSQYFAYDYQGAPFSLFGTWHLVALLVIILINFCFLEDPLHCPLEHGNHPLAG